MRKLAFVLGLAVAAGIAMKSLDYQLKKSTAEVITTNGIYIFMYAKPESEYEFLGTVNMKGFNLSKPAIDFVAEKTRKQYPGAEAVIIKSSNYTQVEAIKFK